MRLLFVFMFILSSSLAESQSRNFINTPATVAKRIEWLNTPEWDSIIKKAKRENKHVLVDCYTTWCMPCRLMDKEVFTDSRVIDFLNDHFVSVKIQMDKTKSDTEEIRKWYKAANRIETRYGISSFPTFLFFSAKGQLIYRIEGYKNAEDFLEVASTVRDGIPRGKYQAYYAFLERYNDGAVNYDSVASMVDTARMLNQVRIADSLEAAYRRHLFHLGEESWYRANVIKSIASLIRGSKDSLFTFLVSQKARVDSVIKMPGFADIVIDHVIQQEMIEPLIRNSEGNDKIAMNWDQMAQQIAVNYGAGFVRKNVMVAKMKWSEKHHMWSELAAYLTTYIQENNLDLNDRDNDLMLNSFIWNAIFKRSVDKDQIDIAISCLKGLIERVKSRPGPPYIYIDTYANLLYKAGRTAEAISQQRLAWNVALEWKCPESFSNTFKVTLEKMKLGLPTWPHYIEKNDIF